MTESYRGHAASATKIRSGVTYGLAGNPLAARSMNNPHPLETDERADWNAGWNDAMREALEDTP